MANEAEKEEKAVEDAAWMKVEPEGEEEGRESKEEAAKKPRVRKYLAKHTKLYPELYRSDVSIHPSYTTFKNLPYHVACRRRGQRIRQQIKRQLMREVMHFAMMQMFAIDSLRIDRDFSVGMPAKTLIVPGLVTANERRRINELLRDSR
ncbi:uncharacterized protein LOC143377923 [Andrena cerasifolii]|uniref:uncharacterized protein LOC143377923 n=1 Tax=Andrena cerasifolii TaxID=2819439 RepID=UPI004037F5FC